MSRLHGWWHRLVVIARGERYARELAAEQRFHRELEAMSHAAGGRSILDAELEARRRFGNPTFYREEVRRMTPLKWIDHIRQDLGYAWRGMRRSPAFTATVVATLALGLGVNAAMYSFLDQVFARTPSGIDDPSHVHRLYINSDRVFSRSGNHNFGSFSYQRFKAVREHAGSAAVVAAFTPSARALLGGGRSDSARVSFVTPEYFRVLGVRPALGRLFSADEAAIEAPTNVVVISDALWRRAFAADSGVLGRVVETRTRKFTIVGVASPGFSGVDLDVVDLWVPLNAFGVPPSNGRPWYDGFGNYLRAIARVESPADAAQLASAGTRGLREVAPYGRPDSTAILRLGPIIEALGPTDRPQEVSIATRLAGVALVVLIIAGANVATLLLLRAASRRREIAVRRALGVSWARLCTQLAIEGALLGLLSGGAAMLFSFWGGAALRGLLLPNVRWPSAPIDARIVLLTGGVAIAVGILVALVPAINAMNPDLVDALKSGSRSGSPQISRTRSVLLVCQAALTVVLLAAAGLFVRSLSNVESIDIGYNKAEVLTTTIYSRDSTRRQIVAAEAPLIAARLQSMAGVSAVATATSTPMNGISASELRVPGRDSVVKVGREYPTHLVVSAGFFEAAGLRLLAGRGFDARDQAGSEAVVVVDQPLARALWPGENPIGKCLIPGRKAGCASVIGVVEHVNRMDIIENEGTQYYLPLTQHPGDPGVALIVRVDPTRLATVAGALRAELARLIPDPTEFTVRSMQQILEPALRPWRLGAVLFSALGLLAMVVASVGIYGVVAYAVAQRTHEMGIRIALGARTRDVLDLVLHDGLRDVTIGIVVGILLSLVLGRFVSLQLFGVTPSDPSVLLIAAVSLCVLVGLASLIPGWRASRVDPVIALRAD